MENSDEIVKEIEKNMLKNRDNGLLLSDEHIEILERYGFDYKKYSSINELIYDLEEYLNETEVDELENILYSLAEFNYYNNTTK